MLLPVPETRYDYLALQIGGNYITSNVLQLKYADLDLEISRIKRIHSEQRPRHHYWPKSQFALTRASKGYDVV